MAAACSPSCCFRSFSFTNHTHHRLQTPHAAATVILLTRPPPLCKLPASAMQNPLPRRRRASKTPSSCCKTSTLCRRARAPPPSYFTKIPRCRAPPRCLRFPTYHQIRTDLKLAMENKFELDGGEQI
ncbi:hypothetical protein OROGR_004858 [Orobanche gracilis]